MTKIKEKLTLALADADTAKELEKFGLTKEVIEGFEELEKPATLDEAIKQFKLQSDLDKKLDKALRTREDNLRAKFQFVEKEQEEDEEEEVDVKDPAMKAMLAQMKKMSDKLEAFEKEKVQETQAQKRARAIENLKSKGIPAVYVHELDLDKDFEEQFEAVSEKFKEDGGAFQAEPQRPGAGRLPNPQNPGTKKPSKEEIAAIVG